MEKEGSKAVSGEGDELSLSLSLCFIQLLNSLSFRIYDKLVRRNRLSACSGVD